MSGVDDAGTALSRRRAPDAPYTIRTTAAAVSTAPTPVRTSASGRMRPDVPPTVIVTETPGEPSAFITIAAHRPLVADHVSSCVPGPEAWATQTSCSVGGASGSTVSPWRR
jgi:hypothetical protein